MGPANISVVNEFEEAELGDRRLNARLGRVVEAIAEHPDRPFPTLLPTDAELEGFYRLLSNDNASFEALLEPHIAATVGRAAQQPCVLVVHDTTDFGFEGETRKGLGRLNRSGQGFFGHFALALSADGRRDPLGIMGVETWVRTEPTVTQRRKTKELSHAETLQLPRESARWGRLVDQVEESVDTVVPLIHVMDSEADDYALLSKLVADRQRFVNRLCYDRRLVVEAADEPNKLKQLLATQQGVCTRTVKLTRRKRAVGDKRKRTQQREERITELAFSATRVVFRTPQYWTDKAQAGLAVNVVHVREVDPPTDVEPVEWILATTEPVDTPEQILWIVDAYRARWVIEEYFKAIKTGCAYQKRQLESLTTLLNALAIFIPIAWNLLRLRRLARSEADVPAGLVLTKTQLEVLRRASKLKLSGSPTVRQAMLAIAQLGGHIRRNGEPGWQVLGRGYTKLLTLVAGFMLAQPEGVHDKPPD